MASTAALPGTSARSWWTPTPASGTAFADLLSAMEAVPEAFLAGKAWIFIRVALATLVSPF